MWLSGILTLAYQCVNIQLVIRILRVEYTFYKYKHGKIIAMLLVASIINIIT